MVALSELDVKQETIEFMDGRVATQLEVVQRYKEYEANIFNDPNGLHWLRWFTAYNSRQTYLAEAA